MSALDLTFAALPSGHHMYFALNQPGPRKEWNEFEGSNLELKRLVKNKPGIALSQMAYVEFD